jgi:hypothetical protein
MATKVCKTFDGRRRALRTDTVLLKNLQIAQFMINSLNFMETEDSLE